MRAVGYIRVSSQDQIAGTSLDSQRASIEAYCTMKGIELVGIYQDPGISGSVKLAERPAGGEMVKMLETGEANMVIISKLDRAFRSASDCLVNIELWEKQGTGLVILNLGGQTVDTSTPTGKFLVTMLGAVAELERNMINERCNEGRKIRKAQGRVIGGTPYGYDVDATKMLVDNSQEKEAIELILSMHTDGHSLRAIARELNRRGIVTKKGRTWEPMQVSRVVKRAG